MRQVTLEPPAGLKAGLYRTYSTMVSQELLDKWLDPSFEDARGHDHGLLDEHFSSFHPLLHFFFA